MKGLRILFLTPYYDSSRGNSITTRRLKKLFENAGAIVHVFPYEEERGKKILPLLSEAEVVHALHIRRTAEWLKRKNITIEQRFFLTSGGTDVNEDVEDKQKKRVMEQLLRQVDQLIVFTADAKERMQVSFPFLQEKITIIPQSVEEWHETKSNIFLPKGYPNIFLPAGLREVKDIFYVFEELKRMSDTFPTLQWVIAGEPLEKKVFHQVKEVENAYPWVHYYSPVPQEEMISFYHWADVVINTSISEGQPLTILEAMISKVAVLARNIPGNRSVIRHRDNGYLFSQPKEFSTYLKEILNTETYRQVTERAYQDVRNYYSPKKELEKYRAIYQRFFSS